MKSKINKIANLAEKLTLSQQKALIDQIMQMMRTPVNDGCENIVNEFLNGLPDCPHCRSKSSLGFIVKKGRNRNGSQRYYCKNCSKLFVNTTKTAYERSRKDGDTWRKFIELTIKGASLKTCSEECEIAYQTAFTWRHKVLNAFQVEQNNVMMDGRIEIDEMLIPLSYKGNHISGGFGSRTRVFGTDNGLPRKAFKRGTDNRSTSSRDKACIFCMVSNGNKGFYAGVPGVGFMNEAMLNATVAAHVNKDQSMIIADKYKATKKYLEENGYNHAILASNASGRANDHKPEIRDGIHMQHVNAMHHHIRDFLRPYCGVSTKYLENYLAMFIWLKGIDAKKKRKTMKKITVARTSSPDCYLSRKAIESRPAVPKCA